MPGKKIELDGYSPCTPRKKYHYTYILDVDVSDVPQTVEDIKIMIEEIVRPMRIPDPIRVLFKLKDEVEGLGVEIRDNVHSEEVDEQDLTSKYYVAILEYSGPNKGSIEVSPIVEGYDD